MSRFHNQFKRIVLASNGYADGNAEAIAAYLISKKIEMLCIVKHPLEVRPSPFHQIEIYRYGQLTETRQWSPPCRTPFTYIFDLFFPPIWSVPKADIWIGFGSLNAFRGLIAKLFRRARTVIYDCVDFSPSRFGDGFLTTIYDFIDRICCLNSEMIWPISESSHIARIAKHRLSENLPFYVVPMGAWMDQIPSTNFESFQACRIVFLGHLIEKQGIQLVLKALPTILKSIPNASLHVVGDGPFAETLHELRDTLGISNEVVFHGFVKSHKEVETILSKGSIAVATYNPSQADFTKYADPGKLKAYLGAGLPIVLTDVSPNAREIALVGGGLIVDYNEEAIAQAVVEILSDRNDWHLRSKMARDYMRQFDWNLILDGAFENLQQKMENY